MLEEKSFKELQSEWYTRLEVEGFDDIENPKHPNKPLKDSWRVTSPKRFQIIQANRSTYQKCIDDFINHPTFIDACKAVIKHGNSKFTIEQVKLVWELHAQGATTRNIAKRVGRVKSRVDDVLKGLKEWMKLMS